jgi:hypothetical protein
MKKKKDKKHPGKSKYAAKVDSGKQMYGLQRKLRKEVTTKTN